MSVMALALCACEGTTLGHFDVEEDLPESRVEGSVLNAVLPALLPALSLDVSASEEFQRQDYDYLTSIQLDSLELVISSSSTDSSTDTLEDGEADDFNFLSEIDIYISAEFAGEINRVLIGSVSEEDVQLDSSVSTLRFVMTGTDILAHVEAEDGYQIEMEAVGDAPPDAIIFGGVARYRVGIGFR